MRFLEISLKFSLNQGGFYFMAHEHLSAWCRSYTLGIVDLECQSNA